MLAGMACIKDSSQPISFKKGVDTKNACSPCYCAIVQVPAAVFTRLGK